MSINEFTPAYADNINNYKGTCPQSLAHFERSYRSIPGGVNSPVRAFSAVGGIPRFIQSAQGCWLKDVDNHKYVDLVCSWGPMIHGHAHPVVIEALTRAAQRGLSFGGSLSGGNSLW